jgi:glycosyltransferase involved in cell wall biosynthesis
LNPELTVIVCTFNRGHLLSETIPSILQQNISNDLYNVLIVNNNSGLSYARNTGYKTATTKWIIYLDDDAIAPETFIKTALAIAISNEYDCFGGVYYPWYKYGKPVWFKDRYASTAEFYKKEHNGLW